MKVVARPNSMSSDVNMQPPQTIPNAPTNSEDQKPSSKGSSENTPHHSKTSQFMLAPQGSKAGKMPRNLFELRKDWPIPPTNNTTTATTSKPPHKDRTPDPGTTYPQCNSTTKSRTMWMGTELPHLQ